MMWLKMQYITLAAKCKETESESEYFTGETPKMTIPHQGLAEEYKSLALSREVNLDTQSFDKSTEEMSESWRADQSLIVLFYLFIHYLKRTAYLAAVASLPCDPLKHIYIYTNTKRIKQLKGHKTIALLTMQMLKI